MHRTSLWFVFLGLAVAGCSSYPSKGVPPPCNLTPSVGTADGLRGDRYCEILLAQGVGDNITACVYNTVGLNDCPDAQWQALTAQQLRREFGASTVVLNGPRYFTMDSNTLTTSSKDVVNFGGVAMHAIAAILVPPGGLIGAHQETFYKEHTIDRRTEYLFLAGRPVYELTAPGNVTYIMQAYSQIVDPTLTAADLPALGRRLELPDGWTYRMRVPGTDLRLRSGGTAYVIQDELQNTYQRID
jgi:hypothetical protein